MRLHRDRTIEVTGSAKRRITSDFIQWQANLVTEDTDRTAAYKALHPANSTAVSAEGNNDTTSLE